MSFPWAYIDKNSALSASGPTGSLQFKTHDVGGNTSLTGSHNLIFHTASSLLALTGTMELVGTASANQINVNVVDKTVTKEVTKEVDEITSPIKDIWSGLKKAWDEGMAGE